MVHQSRSAHSATKRDDAAAAAAMARSAATAATIRMPPFLRKLRLIIETVPEDIAGWNDAGNVFDVLDVKRFSVELKKHFKGTEQTFIRQLHFYGFSKFDCSRNQRASGSSSKASGAHHRAHPGAWSFSHPLFLKDSLDLMVNIQRQVDKKDDPDSVVEALETEVKQLRQSVKVLELTVSGLSSKLSAVMKLLGKEGAAETDSHSGSASHAKSESMEFDYPEEEQEEDDDDGDGGKEVEEYAADDAGRGSRDPLFGDSPVVHQGLSPVGVASASQARTNKRPRVSRMTSGEMLSALPLSREESLDLFGRHYPKSAGQIEGKLHDESISDDLSHLNFPSSSAPPVALARLDSVEAVPLYDSLDVDALSTSLEYNVSFEDPYGSSKPEELFSDYHSRPSSAADSAAHEQNPFPGMASASFAGNGTATGQMIPSATSAAAQEVDPDSVAKVVAYLKAAISIAASSPSPKDVAQSKEPAADSVLGSAHSPASSSSATSTSPQGDPLQISALFAIMLSLPQVQSALLSMRSPNVSQWPGQAAAQMPTIQAL